MNRRLGLKLCGVIAGAIVAPAFARAADATTLTLVVPGPAGGATDFVARSIQGPLGQALGLSVVVDNRGGGLGVPAAEAVMRAGPSSETLLVSFSGFHVMSPHLARLPYDPMKDLQPVCNVMTAPQLLVVRSSLPDIRSVGDLVKFARANPGRLNYASAGNGSVQHIAAELFKSDTKTFITHIPYRGSTPMLTDLLGGQVDITFNTVPPMLQHIQAGKLRALMIAHKTRLPTVADVPTAEEVGLPGLHIASGFAIHAPVGMSTERVAGLAASIRAIAMSTQFQERVLSQGGLVDYKGPAEMRAFEQNEYARWGKIIRERQIKGE